MRYSSRFFLYAPFVLLVALSLGVGVHWWVAASALSKRLDAMNGHQAVPGVTVHFASKTISGFPFRLDVVFKDLQVQIAGPHGPATWRAENFALHRLTYGRDETIFEAAGKQLLTWHGVDGSAHSLPFAAGSLHASAIDDARGLSRFDLDIVDFGSPSFTAARLQFHIRSQATLDIAVGIDDLRSSSRSVLGRAITMLRLTAAATPSNALDLLRAGKSDWRTTIEAWRQNGNLHVDPFDIAWDKLNAHGRGTLGLDAAHRPSGLLDFKIAGMMSLLLRSDVPPGPNRGIASGLTDRAAKAGDHSGVMGAVIGIKDGIVTVGDEPADTVDPLY